MPTAAFPTEAPGTTLSTASTVRESAKVGDNSQSAGAVGAGFSLGRADRAIGEDSGRPGEPLSTGAARAVEKMTASATPGSAAYRIGPSDVLEMSVFKVPELGKAVQVADSGTANFPLAGEVQVVGRTAQEVERDLTRMLGAKYLQNPQVTVFVREYNSQRVTVEGAVKKPGVHPIRGRTTLLQFIAMSDGMDPNAGSEVVIFRQTNGKRAAAKFDIEDIRSGKSQDPIMLAGDVIVVPTSAMKESFNNFIKVVPVFSVFRLL